MTGRDEDTDGTLIGRRVADRYRIDAAIARGGMARVFRAHDERLARDVAVKVLAEPYASDEAFAERFLGEARTAAGLAHTNLVHVYDSGADGDLQYIVMELLTRYRTLRERIVDDGPLPPEEAVDVLRDVLAGLALVHERGFVHCDVKSSNVMVGPGPVKLIDFGIARTPATPTGHGTSLGSLHAMPPEQLRNEALGPASDLFAAGVVLYEALTGRVPFEAATPDEMLAAQAVAPRPPSELLPGIPRRLDDVIAQALRANPDDRFRNARAMTVALEVAAESATPGAPTDETRPVEVAAPDRGYVPPLVMPQAEPGRPMPAPRRERRPSPVAARSQRGSGIGAWLLALAAVGAGALVVWFVLNAGSGLPLGPGGSGSPAATDGAATPTLAPGTVRVPATIGMSEADAEAAARAAGLRWRIEWQENADATPGVYDQEPPAGEIVQAGSPFVMYAWRAPD